MTIGGFQVGWSTSLASLCDRGEAGGWKMEHFSASLQHKLDEIYIRNEKANIGLKFLHGEIPVTLQRLTSKSAASIRNLKEIRKKGKNLTFLGGSE